MGRRRRQPLKSNYSIPTLRVSQPVIAKPRLEVGKKTRLALAQLEQLRNQYLREIEDRRRFHPADRPARDRRSRVAKISLLSLLGSQQSFTDPYSGVLPVNPTRSRGDRPKPYSNKVLICVRRKARREVLMAKGVGRGKKVSRRRQRNSFSNVFC